MADLEARLRALRQPTTHNTAQTTTRPEPALVGVPSATNTVASRRNYDEAIMVAQFAIESERKGFVSTAIDAYIRAGQALITIGRQQTSSHIQTAYVCRNG